jgi:hypothetical protein
VISVVCPAVRRNRDRFPGDFLFELTADEMDALVSQSVIPSRKKFGGAAPYAFTEQGVAMLSSVLRSPRAVEVNIAIMRTFVQLRRLVDSNQAGAEFWSARELARVLKYSEFRHFLPVIEKARDACLNSAHHIADHFEELLEMVTIGSGAQRPVEDWALSRYARSS